MESIPHPTPSFKLILAVGTQVVSRIEVKTMMGEISCLKGMVGVITQAPTDGFHAYQIQLPNGDGISLKRHEFSLRKQFQAEGIERPDPLAEYNLYDHVIQFSCLSAFTIWAIFHSPFDLLPNNMR
jgi:uncharacterized protein